jgi:hypothetical protein
MWVWVAESGSGARTGQPPDPEADECSVNRLQAVLSQAREIWAYTQMEAYSSNQQTEAWAEDPDPYL